MFPFPSISFFFVIGRERVRRPFSASSFDLCLLSRPKFFFYRVRDIGWFRSIDRSFLIARRSPPSRNGAKFCVFLQVEAYSGLSNALFFPFLQVSSSGFPPLADLTVPLVVPFFKMQSPSFGYFILTLDANFLLPPPPPLSKFCPRGTKQIGDFRLSLRRSPFLRLNPFYCYTILNFATRYLMTTLARADVEYEPSTFLFSTSGAPLFSNFYGPSPRPLPTGVSVFPSLRFFSLTGLRGRFA